MFINFDYRIQVPTRSFIILVRLSLFLRSHGLIVKITFDGYMLAAITATASALRVAASSKQAAQCGKRWILRYV
jgi:hypothetical protein